MGAQAQIQPRKDSSHPNLAVLAGRRCAATNPVSLARRTIATLDFTFEDGEPEATVLERFTQKMTSILEKGSEERVHVSITPTGSPQGFVRLSFQHQLSYPTLRCISVSSRLSHIT